VTILFFPLAALAHPGHGESLADGFYHPLLGLDHLLAALAVGIWAAQGARRVLWCLPAAFLGGLGLGGFIGMQGWGLPYYEAGILLTLVILSLALLLPELGTLAQKGSLVFLFGFVHGNAHGMEAGAAAALPFALGFLLSTALLHGLGIVAATSFQKAHPDRGMEVFSKVAGLACLFGTAWLASGR
jgi:urease accessory protein